MGPELILEIRGRTLPGETHSEVILSVSIAFQRSHNSISRLWAASFLSIALCSTAWADLAGEIAACIDRANLGKATISVSVVDADTGRRRASHHGSKSMLPASNMKILTTAAALDTLGPQFEFQTKLIWDGKKLMVVSDGDPSLADPELADELRRINSNWGQPDALVNAWTEAISRHQIGQIDQLVIDDRIFDRQLSHPDWPANQRLRHYQAQVSGFNYHLNVLHCYPRPAGTGRNDVSHVEPKSPWLRHTDKTRAYRSSDAPSGIAVTRPDTSNTLTFTGNVKYVQRDPLRVTMHDPPNFFAELLAHRLTASGTTVKQTTTATASHLPARGTLIEPIAMTPLATVLTRCNRDSENLYAEALLKRIAFATTGKPGTWPTGCAVIRSTILNRIPSYSGPLVVADGSGLSRRNRVSAQLMTSLLHSIHQDDRVASVFLESLALAASSGTMKKRFRSCDLHSAMVRAKSGYIRGVCSLSGYVTAPNGRTCCFSILINDLQKPLGTAQRFQEKIVALIAKDLSTSQSLTAVEGG